MYDIYILYMYMYMYFSSNTFRACCAGTGSFPEPPPVPQSARSEDCKLGITRLPPHHLLLLNTRKLHDNRCHIVAVNPVVVTKRPRPSSAQAFSPRHQAQPSPSGLVVAAEQAQLVRGRGRGYFKIIISYYSISLGFNISKYLP